MLHIEFARRHKGWSQRQLGAVVRINQSFISEIERGVGLPTSDQRQRLARALNVSIETLLQPVLDAVLQPVLGTVLQPVPDAVLQRG